MAATSKRSICWPSKKSPTGCHHKGAVPAVAGPALQVEVPVQNQAWRLFQVTAASVAAQGGQQQADAEADRDREDHQAGDRLPTPVDHQPQAEGDHGWSR